MTIKTDKINPFLNSKFNNTKTLCVGALFILGILTILGSLHSFSLFRFLFVAQFWLFGYFGYIWAFVAAYFLFRCKEMPNFSSNSFLEKTLGVVIGILALLILQGLFFKKVGVFGAAFNSILEPLITSFGVFALILALLCFSIMLISQKTFKELFSFLVSELKDDFKQSKEVQVKEGKKLKNIFLKTKAFFTPAKSDKKAEAKGKERSAPRPLTLEEVIEQNKNNPPPKTYQFDFSNNEDEEQREDESDIDGDKSDDLETFDDGIDALRQDVELPLREDNPLEKETQEVEQIRVITQKEAQAQNFDPHYFQEQSIASLENFKHFEKSHYQTNEMKEQQKEHKDEITLIKAPQQAQIRQESKDLTQEFKTEFKADSTKQPQQPPQRETPKKPIKAYPKNLYAAKPFSAYYEKAQAKDGLLKVESKQLEQDEITKAQEILQEIEPIVTQEVMENIEFTKALESEHLAEQEAQEIKEVQETQVAQEVQEIQESKEAQETQEQEIKVESLEQELVLEPINLEIPSEIPLEQPQEVAQEVKEVDFTKMPLFNYRYIEPLESNAQESQEAQETEVQKVEIPSEQVAKKQEVLEKELETKSEQAPKVSVQVTEIPSDNNFKEQEAESTAQVETIELFSQTPKAQEQTQQTQEQSAPTPQHTQVKTLSENESLLQELNTNEAIANTTPQNSDYELPKLEFLQQAKGERVEVDEIEIDRKINDLLGKLRMFKIEGDIVRTYSGPIVTTFEFRPSPNVKVSRILTLQDDLAMALRAKTIRIQAPVPGKDVVGIEIPNNQIETIYLREILENDLFKNSSSPLTLALGKDIVGNPFVTDLKKLPHLLIAGTTGSGKSVGINAMILSLLYKNSPDNLRLIMIDPKMLEFSIYNDIPHLLTPVITQPKKAIIALENTVKEMERRYALMSEARIKNIEGYNQKAEIEGFEPFPYIVVIIDELADLMMSGGKEAEVPISRLAQMARASGIHIIVATQRPSVDVVTGIIKANLPSRISYKVGQKIDSKVILDTFGAESLLGRGDMLFTPPGGGIVRLHAPWSSEKEIENIVEFIKAQRAPQYDENFMPSESEILGLRAEGETDELYEEAKRIMLSDGKTSISYIQRRLGIGYNKAANIIEQMEARGFLSSANSKGIREIIGE